MLILIFPLAFRITCYYYRGAYYKAFWADPPACAVGEPRNEYRGEQKLPLIIQNVHRYFLYFALVFIVLAGDRRGEGLQVQRPRRPATRRSASASARWSCSSTSSSSRGYTFGCHSLRHLVGGVMDTLLARRRCARRRTTA